jgi:hypothetical protein
MARCPRRPGFKLASFAAPRDPSFYMGPADIDGEDPLLGLSLHDLRTIAHLSIARQSYLLT